MANFSALIRRPTAIVTCVFTELSLACACKTSSIMRKFLRPTSHFVVTGCVGLQLSHPLCRHSVRSDTVRQYCTMLTRCAVAAVVASSKVRLRSRPEVERRTAHAAISYPEQNDRRCHAWCHLSVLVTV